VEAQATAGAVSEAWEKAAGLWPCTMHSAVGGEGGCGAKRGRGSGMTGRRGRVGHGHRSLCWGSSQASGRPGVV
jgi:hypothetical protein